MCAMWIFLWLPFLWKKARKKECCAQNVKSTVFIACIACIHTHTHIHTHCAAVIELNRLNSFFFFPRRFLLEQPPLIAKKVNLIFYHLFHGMNCIIANSHAMLIYFCSRCAFFKRQRWTKRGERDREEQKKFGQCCSVGKNACERYFCQIALCNWGGNINNPKKCSHSEPAAGNEAARERSSEFWCAQPNEWHIWVCKWSKQNEGCRHQNAQLVAGISITRQNRK